MDTFGMVALAMAFGVAPMEPEVKREPKLLII